MGQPFRSSLRLPRHDRCRKGGDRQAVADGPLGNGEAHVKWDRRNGSVAKWQMLAHPMGRVGGEARGGGEKGCRLAPV